MTSTREKILHTLLTQQTATIIELANQVGINPISVRHHIIKLQAEGLVDSEEVRHGVGRPRRVYFLTRNGAERFPTRYMRLANMLLDQLKTASPGTPIQEIFSQIGQEMASRVIKDTQIDQLTLEERLEILRQFLKSEGFNIEWQPASDGYLIKELNCPYYHVGQEHPEICVVDQTLIASLLSVPAKKVGCILDGDAFCTYQVNRIPLEEVDLPAQN